MIIIEESKDDLQIKQCLSVIFWVLDTDINSIKNDDLILSNILNKSCKNIWNSLSLTLRLSRKLLIYDSVIDKNNIKHFYKIEDNILIPFEISLIERNNSVGILTMLYFKSK